MSWLPAVLVVLYYVLPLDQPWNGDAAMRVLIGLLVFAGIAVWQVRSIAGSHYPGMKAFEALGLIVPFYLLVFASTYFVMDRASAASFTQPLTRTDALYFTVTVFSTVGFGASPPSPRPLGCCSSSRCSATLRCWAQGCGCCWGQCVEASNEARTRTAKQARPPGEGSKNR